MGRIGADGTLTDVLPAYAGTETRILHMSRDNGAARYGQNVHKRRGMYALRYGIGRTLPYPVPVRFTAIWGYPELSPDIQ